ncbi:dihydrolipoamide acetyltransferase family protein [Sinomonas sp. ASV486]|uniref:dihydrolipoamide acetyltransferase family protein n=1 Tax=Sinomonas sp. ASV486 TaxID=3051170 RepID=UPI0027DD4DD8|nr:dihydrolipoamide acetyltransferase family protein [Sinomonas sp. ASV486]MDQ4490797.1 dihydrolipoamide acetyltransferase family protein [Sinomonas sp. ASV486]
MATIITMPAVVADATEAALQDWLVAVGDTIAVGQPIAEIETEKATVELEAEATGTVGRLLIDPGTSVEVGEPIAVLVQAGEDEATIDREIAAAGHAVLTAAGQPVPHDTEAPAPDHVPAEAPNVEVAEPQVAGRVFSSPLARKLAKDMGVTIADLTGSGPDGRILRRDVETAAQRIAAQPAAPQEPVAAKESEEPRAATEGYEDKPLSGMRRAIARRLTESKTKVPHFYASADVTMDALLDLRTQVNASLAAAGQKATVNDLILKALAGALVDVPAANVAWQGDRIRYFRSVDISVAIATDDGLLTPVVRNLENMSIGSVCRATSDYKQRADAGKIRQQELEGGSFSLTNLGMYGTREFSAILNPPQAGILAVGAAEPRPVVTNGELTIATVMTCTLSADHRAIDGAVAAQLLAAFKRRIENPMSILL